MTAGLYGAPPIDLAVSAAAATQFSPLVPGAAALEDLPAGTLSHMTMLAPPGTVERRYALALMLRALAPGAPFTVLAPKDKGGARLRKELDAFGCTVNETAKRHYRICTGDRPTAAPALDDAIAAGAPREAPELGLWSQPGVFSWNRIDPGSAVLMRELPALSRTGADFGCGIGVLAQAILKSPQVTQLTLIDIDRRAVDAARRNVTDPRTTFLWADIEGADLAAGGLDFVVMNPPFHDGGAEDRALGRSFIARAARALRGGGVCWLVANRHLPYEDALAELFARFDLKAQEHGYKVYEAIR